MTMWVYPDWNLWMRAQPPQRPPGRPEQILVRVRHPSFTADQIHGEVSPMLLPAGRIVGNDGVFVSARQICQETGIDLELLEEIQRAMGLPRAEDPDAAVHLRSDSEAAARASRLR